MCNITFLKAYDRKSYALYVVKLNAVVHVYAEPQLSVFQADSWTFFPFAIMADIFDWVSFFPLLPTMLQGCFVEDVGAGARCAV